jgi:hypothetical protein
MLLVYQTFTGYTYGYASKGIERTLRYSLTKVYRFSPLGKGTYHLFEGTRYPR